MSPQVQIIIMAACLLMSAYFSATETAFSTLSKTKLKTMIEKGNKRAGLALKLSEKYDRLLSTILIGNNLVNILLSSIATVFVITLCVNGKDQAFADNYGTLIATAAVTVVVLIFGEITPKSIAKNRPEGFAMFSAPLMQLFIWILIPFSVIFSLWTKLVAKIFRVKADNKMSQEELLMLVEEVQEEGSIDDEEGDLLRNAINFTEQKAEDILTHRVDLEGFDIETPIEEIGRLFEESRFSRLLVYEDSIDKIVGVVHSKDVFTAKGLTDKPLDQLISPPLYIHKGERIDDLLRDLQTNKSHLAVVLDEYGGTLGIVTMEDILEELVGDIWDEHDEVVEDYKEIAENTFRIDCGGNLEDFCEFFDLDIESDSITINGWIMEVMDKIPACGDRFSFENLDVTVTETDFHRVSTIHVVRHEPSDDEDDNKSRKDKDDDRDDDDGSSDDDHDTGKKHKEKTSV
ncbi:MAG: HlyC/CorC family transporter [Clostridia bacterium]|nr:HlyC/CorC family transporter [Clostridia bacterium]